MIKFFRKIRQSLLKENRVGKYLLYALGEIILVMIGILLALQVNEWNNERNRHNAEEVIVEQLKVDLQTSQRQLESLIGILNRRAEASAIVCHAFWKKDIPNDSIFNYMNTPLATRIYSPILGTAKSIISSGDLALIESNQLKNQITYYVERVESYLKDIIRYEETYYRNGILLLREVIPASSLTPRSEFLELLEERNSANFDTSRNELLSTIPNKIEKIPFEADLQILFQDMRIYSAYSLLLVGHRNSSIRYSRILTRTNKLLEELEQYSIDRE